MDEYNISVKINDNGSKIEVIYTYKDSEKSFPAFCDHLLRKEEMNLFNVLTTISELIKNGWPALLKMDEKRMTLVLGDVSEELETKFEVCYEKKICTKVITDTNFIKQIGFRCLDCFPEDSTKALCKVCSGECHLNHNLVPIPDLIPMFCDCDEHCLV